MPKRLWDLLGDSWNSHGLQRGTWDPANLVAGAGLDEFSNRWTKYVIFAAVALVVAGLLWSARRSRNKSLEPPLARSSIPVLGHLIGLLKHQLRYFDIVSAQNPWPIFTIKIMSSRTYVIRSPRLIQAALSNPKAFSFDPFSLMFSRKALAGTKATMAIMEHTPTEKGESAYLLDLHTAMYGALALGPSLLDTNKKVLNSLAGYLNVIGAHNQPRSLYSWLKLLYTMSSAQALYGANNPFTYDPALVDYVWDFEETFNMLMMDVLPTMTAKRGCKARSAVTAAFTKYYETGQDRLANQFVQGRAAVGRKWGMTARDCGSFEIGIIFASTTNATPTAFWMLCFILSDPELTARVAAEAANVTTTHTTDDGVKRATMDMTSFQTKCPLLIACFHETLRLVNAGTSVRWVTEDTMLDSTYLLKKDGIIQMPASVLHNDAAIWGPDAATFNPARFLDLDSLPKDVRRARKDAFIPFGGGRHLCPGRHLAFTEIVAFVAMLALAFEVRADDGQGQPSGLLGVPPSGLTKWGSNTRKPEADVDVLLRRREGWRDCVLGFDVGKDVDFENLSPE